MLTISALALYSVANAQLPMAERFTGNVTSKSVVTTDNIFNYSTSEVTFEPGARTKWHAHDEGQILICTAGEGWYQEQGKEARHLHAGDVVKIPPRVIHWHGAAANNLFTHLSQIPHQKDGKTQWHGAVEQVDYAALPHDKTIVKPIELIGQGSFMAGGKVLSIPGTYSHSNFRNPSGQTAHVDQAYTFYQYPINAKETPLVMLHGGGQSGKTWETTPDGREGFQNIFLRKGYPVYIVDQPRRGRAGSAADTVTVAPRYFDNALFCLFRIGDENGKPFAGSQFPTDSTSIDQLMKWGTPDTGGYDDDVTSDALTQVLNESGAKSILVTHSRGGFPGWLTGIKSDNLKAIISLEPGGSQFVFPNTDVPDNIQTSYGELTPYIVSLDAFKKLTRYPIVIYYGDFLATNQVEHIGMDQWRGEMEMAKKMCGVINKYGGHAEVIHLPEIGIKGNTHFLMADKNNTVIADLIERWIHENVK